jgi:hypothetical protein
MLSSSEQQHLTTLLPATILVMTPSFAQAGVLLPDVGLADAIRICRYAAKRSVTSFAITDVTRGLGAKSEQAKFGRSPLIA